jgi:hypothetical protein
LAFANEVEFGIGSFVEVGRLVAVVGAGSLGDAADNEAWDVAGEGVSGIDFVGRVSSLNGSGADAGGSASKTWSGIRSTAQSNQPVFLIAHLLLFLVLRDLMK